MIKNPIVLALISAILACVIYVINNRCNDEEVNKVTMIKLAAVSGAISLLTYFFLNSGEGISRPSQDVLTGDPGF